MIFRSKLKSCGGIWAKDRLRIVCTHIQAKAKRSDLPFGSSDFSARLAGRSFDPSHSPRIFNHNRCCRRCRFTVRHFAFEVSKTVRDGGSADPGWDSDERAQFLATTPIQMFLNLIEECPGLPPPSKSIEWTADEREMVAAKFGAAIVGGPERVATR